MAEYTTWPQEKQDQFSIYAGFGRLGEFLYNSLPTNSYRRYTMAETDAPERSFAIRLLDWIEEEDPAFRPDPCRIPNPTTSYEVFDFDDPSTPMFVRSFSISVNAKDISSEIELEMMDGSKTTGRFIGFTVTPPTDSARPKYDLYIDPEFRRDPSKRDVIYIVKEPFSDDGKQQIVGKLSAIETATRILSSSLPLFGM
jgi:hypothetical protein